MDTVLEYLFLRRLKFNYICPPVCPIFPLSGSGASITGQIISPLTPMPRGSADGAFLTFGPTPGALCYGIYQENNGVFTPIAQCVQPHTFATCCAGCYQFSVITQAGEGPRSDPVCTDGALIEIQLPSGLEILGYNIYREVDPLNPGGTYTLILSGNFFNVFLACDPGCYSFTAITADGETPFNEPFCIPEGGCANPVTFKTALFGYWPLDEQVGVTPVYNPPAIDFSGHNENLTYGGGTASQSLTGKVDRCFEQSNQLGRLFHVDDPFLGLGPGASFTMTGWTFGLGYSFSSTIVYSKWNAINKDWAVYFTSDGIDWNMNFRAYDLSGAPQTATYTVPVAGHPDVSHWHFIAFGYDDSLQQIWIQIDGGVKTTAPCVGVRRTSADFALGDRVNTADIVPSTLGVGSWDETAFWKRPLTDAELLTIYNTGLAGQPLTTLF